MSFTEDFAEFFTETATWFPLTTRDTYAKPSFGTGKVYMGRLVRENKLVRNREGQLVTSSAHWWFGPPATSGDPDPPPFLPEDRLQLSDGSQPPILMVDRKPDENGAAITKIFFL